MNYSKNLNKREIEKRFITILSIVALLFVLLGGALGYGLKTHIIAKSEQKTDKQGNEQITPDLVIYGVYDNHMITQEISVDWCVSDLDFIPLDCNMPREQQEFLFYLCDAYNLDFALIMALIQYESNYQADAISRTNDYGLMQINQINHEWLTETLGVTNYLDPYQNIRAGCFVIRKLFEKYQGVDMVLMAYNMGETGASHLWEKGVYSTDYSEDILNIQQQFIEQLEGVTNAEKLESN